MWPGTQAVSNAFPDPGIPAAYYRVQQPAILSGMNIHCNTGPSGTNTTTFQVYRTPGPTGTMTAVTGFIGTLTGTNTDISYYNTTQDFAAGDLLHLGVTYTTGSGANNNKTHDITVQLDMF